MHLRKVCPLFPPTNWWFLMSKCLQEAWVNMLFPEKIQAPWVLEVLGKPSRCQQEISIQNIPWSGETSSTVDFDEFKMVTFVISHVVLVVFLPTWSCNSMGRNAGVISLRCCSTCWTHPRKGMIKQTYFSCVLRSRVQSRRLRRTRNFWVILLEVWHVPTHIYIIQSRATQFFARDVLFPNLFPLFLVQRFLVMNHLKIHAISFLKWVCPAGSFFLLGRKLRFGYRICVSPQDCQCGGGVSKSIQRFTSSDDYGFDDVCLSLCRYGFKKKKRPKRGKGKRLSKTHPVTSRVKVIVPPFLGVNPNYKAIYGVYRGPPGGETEDVKKKYFHVRCRQSCRSNGLSF